MNKKELIDVVTEKSGLNKKQAEAAVSATFEAISDTLGKKENFSYPDFGSFSVKTRAARTGRNPKTKEPIEIPATNVPAFKAGKALKELVNG